MQIYIVLWDHNHRPCWPPDQVIWRSCLSNSCKIWAPDGLWAPFSEVPVSCSEATQVLKDSISQPIFPVSIFVTFWCVIKLKTAQAEAPNQVDMPFTQEDSEYVLVHCLCIALGVVACQELSAVVSDLWGPEMANTARHLRDILACVCCIPWQGGVRWSPRWLMQHCREWHVGVSREH